MAPPVHQKEVINDKKGTEVPRSEDGKNTATDRTTFK